jgi:predicted TIM-barrel fold metal-dependent hydrolase
MKKYLILSITLLIGCSRAPDFYTFPKIDAHVHLETSDDAFVGIVEDARFKLMTLVTRSEPQPVIRKEFDYAKMLHDKHPQTIAFATTFTMEGFGEPEWERKTLEWLKKSFSEGAIALKLWKDIGMTFQDSTGNFIMIDDPRFDPILDFVESEGKTFVNHNGEPRNCWLPIAEMTVRGDSNYFANHPQYHMYRHPECPTYETLNAARDRMLEKHPGLRYVGCHLGSLEWDVDELARTLDRFPNMSVDMAARIAHFKVQDREKVRNFIIKYQDRLLYATDVAIKDSGSSTSSSEKAEQILRNTWMKDWEYFTTDRMFTQNDKVKEYLGLKLPVPVLRKIYYENAIRMYPEIGQ